ncbi:MAG: hypothetical protein J6A69_00090 [Clostridia bacterium]|nr:hypothetical protein [Clostridia bacterium]
MFIKPLDDCVRYTGRWFKTQEEAVTTAPGSYFEIGFKGSCCVLNFDVYMNFQPYGHIYIQLDNGARTEVAVDRYIRVQCPDNGEHILKVIYKSAMELQPRWYEPLIGKVTFMGAEADGTVALQEDRTPVIEFIGDSITEGIWVDEDRKIYGFPQENMVFQNDSTATYAYLTAEALKMRPWIIGYGAVGITKCGHGGVPSAIELYPYCYNGKKALIPNAEMIVINYGANDIYVSKEEYIDGYKAYLDFMRKINPHSKIIVLSPFSGYCAEELGKMVNEYNKKNKDSVYYINTKGWISPEPLHPSREGHKTVSENLIPILTKIRTDEI